MIQSDEQLEQAIEQLGQLYKSLILLKKNTVSKNLNMIEGSFDKISQLQQLIEEYVWESFREPPIQQPRPEFIKCRVTQTITRPVFPIHDDSPKYLIMSYDGLYWTEFIFRLFNDEDDAINTAKALRGFRDNPFQVIQVDVDERGRKSNYKLCWTSSPSIEWQNTKITQPLPPNLTYEDVRRFI